jgi:hypothetical protein
MAKKVASKTESSGSPDPAPRKPAARKSNGGGAVGAAVADGQLAAPAADAVQPVQVAIPASPGVSAERTAPKPEITHQRIAERAYELYTQGAPGSPTDHWLQAEHELRGNAE